MSGPDAALACCRFVHDAAAMLLWGAFGFIAVLVPRDLGEAVAHRLEAWRRGAVALTVATTALSLPIEAAAIGNGWADLRDGATLQAVLFDTSVGHAWDWQAGAASLLAATLALPARLRSAATAVAAGLLLATLALTGHAAMHEGTLGLVHRFNDITHVWAGGAWLGALVPLLTILRDLDDPARRSQAGVALRRFSSAGHAAVAVVLATGVANALLVLDGWPPLTASPYPLLLMIKIAMVLVMTGLAIANRYVFVPRLAGSRVPVRVIVLGTAAEIGLGLAAIGCVAVFGLLEPV